MLNRVLTGAGLCLSVTLAAQMPDELKVRKARAALGPFLDIAATYAGGELEKAIADIRKWPRESLRRAPEQLEVLQNRLTLPPASPDLIDVTLVEASVLLLTDAGLQAFEEQAEDEAHLHLNTARNILTLLAEAIESSGRAAASLASRGQVIGRRDWHLAVITVLQGMVQVGEADRLATLAIKLFPGDAELQLAAGSAKEELANELFRGLAFSERPRDSQMPARMQATADAQAQRNLARDLYQRAIQLDPGLIESRVRLGRVLTLNGRLAAARRELDAALDATTVPRLRYLAHLFTGAIHEREKRWAEAAQSYERAIEIDPDAQTARVALAHALDAGGALEAAGAAIEPFLGQVEYRPVADDAWWLYPLGQSVGGTMLLDLLRKRVVHRRTPAPPDGFDASSPRQDQTMLFRCTAGARDPA